MAIEEFEAGKWYRWALRPIIARVEGTGGKDTIVQGMLPLFSGRPFFVEAIDYGRIHSPEAHPERSWGLDGWLYGFEEVTISPYNPRVPEAPPPSNQEYATSSRFDPELYCRLSSPLPPIVRFLNGEPFLGSEASERQQPSACGTDMLHTIRNETMYLFERTLKEGKR